MFTSTFILRITLAVILIMHSIPGMFTGAVNDFGDLFLNKIGFSPVGVPLAYMIKLSHVVCAGLLIFNRFIRPACIITIFIFIMGIFLVHLKDGWYVVGGGSNGIEYNILLIGVLIYLIILNEKPEPMIKSL